MKKLLILASLVFSCFVSLASVWTFHGFKDNFMYCDVWNPSSRIEYLIVWDFDSDAAFPDAPWSGIWTYTDTSESYQGPYLDVISVVGDNDSTWGSVVLNGPYPDYNGGGSPVILYSGGGEFWIDFDSLGGVRISTTQSSDFGKWAWDGSINPSWIEPSLAPVERTKRGNGHSK